jgi:hypothetical protein
LTSFLSKTHNKPQFTYPSIPPGKIGKWGPASSCSQLESRWLNLQGVYSSKWPFEIATSLYLKSCTFRHSMQQINNAGRINHKMRQWTSKIYHIFNSILKWIVQILCLQTSKTVQTLLWAKIYIRISSNVIKLFQYSYSNAISLAKTTDHRIQQWQ